jgi:alanine racemase
LIAKLRRKGGIGKVRATRAVIHLERLRRNIALIRARVGKRLICAPVKADAYGHGAARVAKACVEAGVQYLAVATVAEGAELREAGVETPILLLSYPLPEELGEVVALRLTVLGGDAEFFAELNRVAAQTGVQQPVHLKIDTGMGRMGCTPEDAPRIAAFIGQCANLRLEGIATHLAVSDSLKSEDKQFTKDQLARFADAVFSLKKAGIDAGIVHAAASGGVLLYEESYFDMVRPGILLYGYAPAPALAPILPVEPVMELVSQIVFIKKVKKGESVSYGRTWIAPRDTLIGALPLGYGDGLNRLLSNNFSVLINEKRYPLIGRICMDQCMVDLGADSTVKRYEKAVIFGAKPAFSAADIAGQISTIPYEITCNINKRVERVFVE